MQTLNIAKQNNADLKKKFADEEHARWSTDSALEGTQRQAKDQRKHLCETTNQLKASKEQMVALREQLDEAQRLKDQAKKAKAKAKKARIEAEKARNEAEQKSYNLGIVKTEVPAVCRIYCAQIWNEALNRAKVEASFELRKIDNIYYPPAMRALDLPSTQSEVAFTVADLTKET